MDAETLEALTGVVAVVLGCMIVLIPIAGITARFALKPVMEAFARYRDMQGEGQKISLLERRLALVEEQQHSQERLLARLSEDADFRRQLEAPGGER